MADLFSGVIRHIIQTAYANREGMGDYRGPDGLMRCGRCHAPVESRMDGIPGFPVVPIMCPCQDQQKQESRIYSCHARKMCFMGYTSK